MINNNIISLIEIRDKAHLAHWNTTIYAKHKALGKFYEGLTDLLDTFVETYQGKYGRIEFAGLSELRIVTDANTLVEQAYTEAEQIEKQIDIKCTDLLNILADIKGLCNHTKYLLTLE
jgi:DNA-binding ferritin-like protein